MEERRLGWARVRTAYDYPGWIRDDALAPLAAEHGWPPATEGDPIDAARAYLSSPYEWGGMSAHGIDCSGLVHMAYRRVGRLIPRDASQQEAAGTPIDEAELRRGDLVTYGNPHSGADHIAFWLGDGRILHATGRPGIHAVVEEPEPEVLARRRRRTIRMS